MDKLGRIYIAELVIECIENESSDDQPEHDQCQHRRMEHPDEHSDMVDGKQNRTEEVSKFHIHILF